ncbi:MAG: hypothetical protein COU63_03730 [Candidatus Pacebacteria bacterium CG10_big_fil_rev_8_21_14_0_10_36_11]|nr:hypothetical protein [Candidatus Pacearchaeota archaeon]PIR64572.1 MAG: hypothetical protein COU63_03730 [Candidatus Pacebacteria bacterium CG10_big_fil_rev_8_21_14_0_10_36_11]PJC42995.1 MAG: hypothetical protein CO040_01490 [Candidatus Pacebacteria bacterium CG_4_9_14_0_2_um_filter_36_8]
MSNIDAPNSIKEIPLVIIKNMVALATSGFGVVVALAWNEAIKTAVQTYIDPILGKNSGVVSLFIYAIIMTLLAVLVTMQLAKMQKTLEEVNESIKKKAKK